MTGNYNSLQLELVIGSLRVVILSLFFDVSGKKMLPVVSMLGNFMATDKIFRP